nr:heavy metal-associated isoprenylated plant protein 47-like [Tanacetum cinerariifolium]
MMQPKCGKCRTKAMMAAAKSLGVNSVELQGKNKNQMVVIGDGVDAAALTSSVRKKGEAKTTSTPTSPTTQAQVTYVSESVS